MSDSSQRFPSPFLLLLKVNLLQAWRRVTQAGSRSGTLSLMVLHSSSGVSIASHPSLASSSAPMLTAEIPVARGGGVRTRSRARSHSSNSPSPSTPPVR